MLKLFKPKKRLIISDIKIPIPMLAGIENATHLTEEEIDRFLRGGKINIPPPPHQDEEKKKPIRQHQNRNMLPVILNEKMQSSESSSDDSDYSDSENDENLIVELLNNLTKARQREEQSIIISDNDLPHASVLPSVPMTEDQKEELIKDQLTTIAVNHPPQLPIIIEKEEEEEEVSKVPVIKLNNQEEEEEVPVIKSEMPPINKNHSSGSPSSIILDVTLIPQKKIHFSEPKKRAELYHEEITNLKYQLEQSRQDYMTERQEHLAFVKESESYDHQIRNQIGLLKLKLDEVLQNNRLLISKEEQDNRLRTSHSYIHLNQRDSFPNDGYHNNTVPMMKDNPIHHHQYYLYNDEQQRANMHQLEEYQEEEEGREDEFYSTRLETKGVGMKEKKDNMIIAKGPRYDDEYEYDRQRGMEAYCPYYDNYYQCPYHYHCYYNKNNRNHHQQQQPCRYFNKRENTERDGRRGSRYYYYWDDDYHGYPSKIQHAPHWNDSYQQRKDQSAMIYGTQKEGGGGGKKFEGVQYRGENAYPHFIPFQ